MNAQELATSLAMRFLEQGQYTSAPEGGGAVVGMIAAGAGPQALAAATALATNNYAGLSVQAVGFNRRENGDPGDKVYVYVSQGSAASLRRLSGEVHDVQVELRKLAVIRVRPEQSASSTNRGHLFLRGTRIACGSSCAPAGAPYSGTLGALVVNDAGVPFLLSNNHVIGGCNHLAIGMPIMAPSTADAHATLPPPIAVGRHAGIVELRSGNPSLVQPATQDAAYASAHMDVVSSWQGDPVYGYDTPTRVVDPAAGMRVKKFGRTTGLTLGAVESVVPTYLPLPYKTKEFGATVWFKDVWFVTGGDDLFATQGDSGSLVVTEDGSAAVGLVFATSGNYALIIPIRTILDTLRLSLIGNHAI